MDQSTETMQTTGYAQLKDYTAPQVVRQDLQPQQQQFQQQPQHAIVFVQTTAVPVDDPSCAMAGCVLGVFFPIVGWITFCVNMDALAGSERRRWSMFACIAATIAFIVSFCVILAITNSY